MTSSRPAGGSLITGMIVIFALIIGALYYFVHAPSIEELAAARRDASEASQNAASLSAQVDNLEAMLADFRQMTEGLEAQLSERDSELSVIRTTQTELIAVFQQEIADGLIQVERMQDNLRVDLVNEILFDSGSVTLNPEGIDVLRRVGDVLDRAADKQIVVQGHTDNVRIGGRLAERFATNWELSATRAINVARFLQDEVNIDPARLSAAGFSEYRPREDNESIEGRQMNRRIEIILAPLPEPYPD